MELTPELIGTITASLMAVTATLNKYTLKLPMTRNGNGKSGMSKFELSECIRKHDSIDHRIDTLEEKVTRNITRLDNKKERLDKGEKRFSGIQNDVQTIKTDVAVIRERIGQQYTQMTDTMQLILKKIDG